MQQHFLMLARGFMFEERVIMHETHTGGDSNKLKGKRKELNMCDYV